MNGMSLQVLGSVTLSLALLVPLAGGCGDDTTDGSGASGAAGPTTSSGGTGGTGGSGGSGGEVPETCASCTTTSCAADLQAVGCLGDPTCAAWTQCLGACPEGNKACADDCNEWYVVPQDRWDALYNCVCTSCNTLCAGLDACNETRCGDMPPTIDTPPATLAETGLYADAATKALNPGVRGYAPAHALWSDGAVKERYVKLPRCAPIDTSDQDHWSFPVGASLWKQFTRDGELIETRYIHRYGPDQGDFVFASYQWDDSGNATHVPAGVVDANGTAHNIPPEGQCTNCHAKLTERILGFSAIQLSHSMAGSENFESLVRAGRIVSPSSPTGYPVPGNAVESAALGYLHANCGNCHNDTGAPVGLQMRLLTSQTTVETTNTFVTGVGQNAQNFCGGNCDLLDPVNPDQSAVLVRMNARGDGQQMPPLVTQATEIQDDTGIMAVRAWVDSLQ